MTIQPPPRRELPPHIKERMRPKLTTRTTHRAWVGAAAAALLVIAGGVFVATQARSPQLTNSAAQPAAPYDVGRCRTALGNGDWDARYALHLMARTVLLGTDNQLCELTRSTITMLDVFDVPAVRTPSGLVAGRPPTGGALTALQRDKDLDSRPETVMTTELFLVDADQTKSPDSTLTLRFDGRQLNFRLGDIPGRGAPSESYASGDPSPASPVNVLARCQDNAVRQRAAAGVETDWKPGASAGVGSTTGVLLAYNSKGEWGSCETQRTEVGVLAGSIATPAMTNYVAKLIDRADPGLHTIAGILEPSITSVELVSPPEGFFGEKVEVVGRSFAVQFKLPPGKDLPEPLTVRLYGPAGEVKYEGPLG